jgi:hypothetical protein
MEGDEMARQPIAGDGLTGVNRESAALQSAQFGEDKLGRLSSRQNGASLDKKQRAGFGQLDAAADPVEEFCAMASFQRRNRGADRGLRDVERFGGARNVLTFSDCDENAELFERHRGTISGRNLHWLHEVLLERPGFSSGNEVRPASEGRFHRTSRSLAMPDRSHLRTAFSAITRVANDGTTPLVSA